MFSFTRSFRLTLVLCFTLHFTGFVAQQLHFTNLSNVLNLPSNECYNVIQDKKGYIWICTDAGLCRYNGNGYKLYNKYNGLPENSIYFIRENSDSTITMITSKNRILTLKNDSITEQPLMRSLSDTLVKKMDVGYSLNTDREKNIFLNGLYRTYKTDSNGRHVINYDNKNNEYHTNANYIIDIRSGKGFLVRNRITSEKDLVRNNKVSILIVSDKGRKEISITLDAFPDFRIKLRALKKYIFFNINNKLIRVDEQLNYNIYDFPAKILALHADTDKGLWICTFHKGVYFYSDVDSMTGVKTGLEGLSVSGAFVDREGGIWCSTLEKGMFYCSNRYVNYYSNVSGLRQVATFMKCINEEVFLATGTDHLYVINKTGIHVKKSVGMSGGYDITDIFNSGSKCYIATKGSLVISNKNFSSSALIRSKTTDGNIAAFGLDHIKDKIYGIASNAIFTIEKNKALVLAVINSQSRNLIIYNQFGFVGCFDGLYRISLGAIAWCKIKGISATVTKTLVRASGTILVSTKNEGLFLIKGDSAVKMKIHTPVQPEFTFDITEDKYKNLWIATNTGLLKINHTSGQPVSEYNVLNGLPSNDIKKIAVTNDHIFVSTTEGLCSIPLEKRLTERLAPNIYLNAITVNDQPASPAKISFSLPYYKNSLGFVFDVLTFKRGNAPLLMYKLNGMDRVFKTSSQNELHFDNLPPGNYELVVFGLSNTGLKSSMPVKIRLMIQKPFWQTLWFISACFLLFFSVLFFIVRSIIRNIKRKEAEKTRINKVIAESQLSALQARMNPHFIFNAINSIQNYILNKAEEEAYNYLAKFSRLVRMVLNNSKSTTISLHEELETLRLYIELEQLRFAHSFNYTCKLLGDMDEYEVQLPVMLIQPYIENAIGHGLINLQHERVGILKLVISKERNLLKIVIEDNGVGRDKSNAYKKENIHQPVAMKLNEERLEMIGKITGYEEIKISIIDLVDDAGNGCGTLVELYLPLSV